MEKKDIEKTLTNLMSNAKERKFVETVELIITFKNLNIKNKEHRFDFSVNLPYPYKTKIKSLIFVKDKNLEQELKGIADKVIMNDEISKISKKDVKKLANEFDVFFAEGQVMLTVGKYLGQILSPRGKMPVVVPSDINVIKGLINSSISKERLSNKKNKFSVALQTKIGKRSQTIDQLVENAFTVYNNLLEKLPVGKYNIKNVFLKTTMSSPKKVGEDK